MIQDLTPFTLLERLERYARKRARAVLRGRDGGDTVLLPGTWVGNHPGLPGNHEFPFHYGLGRSKQKTDISRPDPFSSLLSPPTASLIFATTATGAGIIASHLP